MSNQEKQEIKIKTVSFDLSEHQYEQILDWGEENELEGNAGDLVKRLLEYFDIITKEKEG